MALEDVKAEADRLVSGCRHAARESVFRDRACVAVGPRATEREEGGAIRLPAHLVREQASGCEEVRAIRRQVNGLDDVTGVILRTLTVAPDGDGHLAAILRDGRTVPRENHEARRRIERRDVINRKGVQTVAEAPGEGDLGARPAARRASDAEV